MIVKAGREPLLMEHELAARCDRRALTDAEARTIASWFQTSGPVGAAFAELASTGRADAGELCQNVTDTIRHDRPDSCAIRDLCDLYAWVVGKGE